MNTLSEIFVNVSDGQTVTLEKNKIYSIAPEDSFHLTNCYFSNTAAYDENPTGERYCGIFLRGKKNIMIEGNGAKVMIHGIMTPFIFDNCENITMKDIVFDHCRPTMSEFTVAESEKGKAVIKIPDEFLYRIEGNCIYWLSDENFSGGRYWEIKYKGKGILSNMTEPDTKAISSLPVYEGDSWSGVPDIEHIEEISPGTLKLTFSNKNVSFKTGTVVHTRSIKRYQTGGAITECKNITFDRLRIMSMNCFGILAQNSENITYKDLDCTPAQGRMIVSDADFFHFSGCRGEINILNCKAAGSHDDILNVHGTHLRIMGINREERTLLLRYCHKETWGFTPYRNGDAIEFISGDTLQPYGSATVLKTEKLSPFDFSVTVDSLPDVRPKENDVIENVSATATVNVSGCDFERTPRGILCTTRKQVNIKNNTFKNTGYVVLCVADDANFWFESGRGSNICFEENTLINCCVNEVDKGCDIVRYEPVVKDKTSVVPVHEKLIFGNNRLSESPAGKYSLDLNYLSLAYISENECDCQLEIKHDGIGEVIRSQT